MNKLLIISTLFTLNMNAQEESIMLIKIILAIKNASLWPVLIMIPLKNYSGCN